MKAFKNTPIDKETLIRYMRNFSYTYSISKYINHPLKKGLHKFQGDVPRCIVKTAYEAAHTKASIDKCMFKQARDVTNIPKSVLKTCNKMFKRLDNVEGNIFVREFLNAIPIGADLRPVSKDLKSCLPRNLRGCNRYYADNEIATRKMLRILKGVKI